ncbi:hypothetical protein J6590_101463, partial [Homalodisca vitripennis]
SFKTLLEDRIPDLIFSKEQVKIIIKGRNHNPHKQPLHRYTKVDFRDRPTDDNNV